MNLQSINKNVYFEFYLNDNLLYRYNLNTDTLDISLKDLCYYLTEYLYKQYKFKRNTGGHYNFQTVLWFCMLIHLHPTCADIDQTEEVSKKFPLDLLLPEAEFSNNLYLNIVFLAGDLIEQCSYIEELQTFRNLIPKKSNNVFWKLFPSYGVQLSTFLNTMIVASEGRVQKLYLEPGPSEQLLETTIEYIARQIEVLQEQSVNVLNCYDDIMNQYCKYVRLSRFPHYSIHIQNGLREFAKQKLNDYFNYFQGNFSLLKQPQLTICNKYMAHSFYLPNSNNYSSAKNFENVLQTGANNMLSQKNLVIDKLNQLQQQAIILWNK